MLYKITLEGSGGEIMIGKISRAKYDYWSNVDEIELRDALNGEYDGDVPEDVLIGERYDYMGIFFSSAVSTTYFDLTIQEIDPEDEDSEDAYYNFDDLEHLQEEVKNIEEIVLKYPKNQKTFLYSIDEESGILIEEDLELDERFVLDKLKVKTIALPDGSIYIWGLEYDGISLTEYTDDFGKGGGLSAAVFTKE